MENAALSAEKSIPYNLEAEEAVLGSILIDREAIIKVAAFLRPDDFFSERNGTIYRVVRDLYDRQMPGDFLTVTDDLQRLNLTERVGGISYVSDLVSAVPTAAHVEYYGHIVERTATMRRLIQAGGEIAALGYDDAENVEQALDRAQQVLFRVSERRISRDFSHIGAAVSTFHDQLGYLVEHRGEIMGVRTGFADLDRITGGLRASDLIILAGRPSVGKTGLALTMARNAAIRFGQAVAIFSLEMSVNQLVQRLLASEANIDSQVLRTGYIDDYEWHRINNAFGVLNEAPIYIDDTAGLTAMELRSKARRLKAEADIKLIIVDYLQLMAGSGRENRTQEVGEISRSLKGLARELDVPVVALSQLSRAVEHRPDHRPILSDLRESGSIEQDADIVMFVHREELYDQDTERRNIADLLIAKHRNGPITEIHLRFFPGQTRFADLETYHQSDNEYFGDN